MIHLWKNPQSWTWNPWKMIIFQDGDDLLFLGWLRFQEKTCEQTSVGLEMSDSKLGWLRGCFGSLQLCFISGYFFLKGVSLVDNVNPWHGRNWMKLDLFFSLPPFIFAAVKLPLFCFLGGKIPRKGGNLIHWWYGLKCASSSGTYRRKIWSLFLGDENK